MMKCALDDIEEQLKKEGKTYFRIGRAIFVIEQEIPDLSDKEVFKDFLSTPIGTAASISGTAHKALEDMKTTNELRDLFLPAGYLKVTVIGDPDAGLGKIENVVKLSGYRYGLDDVIIDGKVHKTTHGDHYQLIRNMLENIERDLSWRSEFCIPADHHSYTTKRDTKTEKRIKNLCKKLLNIVNELENRHTNIGKKDAS